MVVGAVWLAGSGSQGGGRQGSLSVRCLSRYDSGVAAGGGGGRLDCCVPDRLGAEGEGLGLLAQARGTQGPRPFPLPRAFPDGSRAAGSHVQPSAWRPGPWSK